MSTSEDEMVNKDPFNTNQKPYLVAIKPAVAHKSDPQCLAPLNSDVTAIKHDFDFAKGTQFVGAAGIRAARQHQAKLCEYRSANPQMALMDVTNSARKLGNVTADEAKWLTSSQSTTEGCNVKETVFLNSTPLKSVSGAVLDDAYHQIFAFKDSCPAFANSRLNVPDLNTNCRGSTVAVCGQKIKDVVDCCMGRKSGSNCRKDQAPQSTFCDQFMSEYCRTNPTKPECSCMITPPRDPIFDKYKIQVPLSAVCMYEPCVSKPNTTYRTKSIANTKCPDLQICAVNTGDIKFLQGALGNKVNISCENQNQKQTKSSSPTPTATPPTLSGLKNPQVMLYGGIGFGVLIFVIILVALLS